MNDENKITDWNDGLIECAGGGLDDIAIELLMTWRAYLDAEIEERTATALANDTLTTAFDTDETRNT